MTLVSVTQHGRHATLFDAVDQLFTVDPHEVHRHRASDECAAAIEDRSHHCLDRRYIVLLHEAQDHTSAHSHYVHLAQDEVRSATRHHHAKHPFDERLLDAHALIFAQDVQAPEGEEHADFLAHGLGAVCDDEGRDDLVQVVTEHDDGRVVVCLAWDDNDSCCGGSLKRLPQYRRNQLSTLAVHHFQALCLGKGCDVGVETGVRSRDLDQVTRSCLCQRFFQFEQRSRALKATGVDLDGFGRNWRAWRQQFHLRGARPARTGLLIVRFAFGPRRLFLNTMCHRSLPTRIATGQVGNLEPILGQDSLRDVPAQARLAVGKDDLCSRGQLADTVEQFGKWNGQRAGNDATGCLFRFTHVQEDRTLGELFGKMVGSHDGCQVLEVVLGYKARHVDRILGTAIRWSIGKLEVSEVVDGGTQTHGCGQDVDAFVHTVVAGGLSTEQLALGAVEQFDMDWRAARIVSGV